MDEDGAAPNKSLVGDGSLCVGVSEEPNSPDVDGVLRDADGDDAVPNKSFAGDGSLCAGVCDPKCVGGEPNRSELVDG